jgi:5-hydroxyisourate hydrolase
MAEGVRETRDEAAVLAAAARGVLQPGSAPRGKAIKTIEFDRRTLLQTGFVSAGIAAGATSGIAQHPPAKLSTHALDTYLCKKAAGVPIDFSRKDGDAWKLLKTVTADENGRVDEQGPLMTADTMAVGGYELLFYVEEYYKRAGVKLTDPAFLDTVPVRIAIFDAKQSYHVPLYFSPWGILSYRGS